MKTILYLCDQHHKTINAVKGIADNLRQLEDDFKVSVIHKRIENITRNEVILFHSVECVHPWALDHLRGLLYHEVIFDEESRFSISSIRYLESRVKPYIAQSVYKPRYNAASLYECLDKARNSPTRRYW